MKSRIQKHQKIKKLAVSFKERRKAFSWELARADDDGFANAKRGEFIIKSDNP